MNRATLPFFPFLFFMLGLFTNLVCSAIDGWLSWIVLVVFMVIYFLLLLWFTKEVNKEERGFLNRPCQCNHRRREIKK